MGMRKREIGIDVIQQLKEQYPDKLNKDANQYGYSQAFRMALPGRSIVQSVASSLKSGVRPNSR
jgi:hypothetical protein